MNEKHEINTDKLYQDNCHKAKKMLEDPGKIDQLLKRLDKKLRKISCLKKLGEGLTYVPKMGMMLNSWFRGNYTDIPIGTIVAIIVALTYFILPIDLIPDIPPFGYVDDAALIAFVLSLIKDDLDEYMKWRVKVGLDEVGLEDEEYEFTYCPG